MTTIGSLVFCNDCGNLLESSTTLKKTWLKCDVCGGTFKDSAAKAITTVSKPTAFPSVLRANRSNFQSTAEVAKRKDATTEKTCDKCGREEVRFYTQQLRSADEGTTVFYICDCGNRWSENN